MDSFNLEQRGYSIIILLEGTNIMDTIEEEKPNLILLDIMLPGKDGIMILPTIKIYLCPIFFLFQKNIKKDH